MSAELNFSNNFTLIDNAFRCFKLSSIADDRDSTIRIWILEYNDPDTPVTQRVKMFEFGKKRNEPVATLYIPEWNFEKKDSCLPVTCIKQVKMTSKQGWPALDKDIKTLHYSYSQAGIRYIIISDYVNHFNFC